MTPLTPAEAAVFAMYAACLAAGLADERAELYVGAADPNKFLTDDGTAPDPHRIATYVAIFAGRNTR